MFHTRLFVPTLIALCSFALIAARPANCDIVKIEPVADADISNNEYYANTNTGNDPILFGYNDGVQKNSILLQFNFAKIRALSVRSARLRLWSSGWAGDLDNTAPTSIFALSQPWREDEVNWYRAANSINWSFPGGDVVSNNLQPITFATNIQGMTITSGGAGMMEWDITELVRLWVSRQLQNNGLRIDVSQGSYIFESHEAFDRTLVPTIIIDVTR